MDKIGYATHIVSEYSSIFFFIFFLFCAMLVKSFTKFKIKRRKKKGRKKKGGKSVILNFIAYILKTICWVVTFGYLCYTPSEGLLYFDYKNPVSQFSRKETTVQI